MTPDLPEDLAAALAESLAAQADELYAHLPPGEIGDDDPADFAVIEGRLWARHDGAAYSLLDGAALRYRRLSTERVEVTAWRNGLRLGVAVTGPGFNPEAEGLLN